MMFVMTCSRDCAANAIAGQSMILKCWLVEADDGVAVEEAMMSNVSANLVVVGVAMGRPSTAAMRAQTRATHQELCCPLADAVDDDGVRHLELLHLTRRRTRPASVHVAVPERRE